MARCTHRWGARADRRAIHSRVTCPEAISNLIGPRTGETVAGEIAKGTYASRTYLQHSST
eukprot:3456874-Pleurochrysis_carterae.AAC.2